MKHVLTREQVLGAAFLIALVICVKVFVRFVPQHVFSPEIVADTMMTEQTLSSDTFCLRPFDPNTADSLTLIRLGLRPWQVRNMLHYRAKNGRYRTPEDFSRLYGLTDSAFQVLLPYIDIDTMPFYVERMARHWRDSLRKDSIRSHYRAWRDSVNLADSLWRDSIRNSYARHEKRDTVLELNSADTASLQLIRGIGRSTAIKIVHYRSQLGGFVSVHQLHDVQMRLSFTLADSILSHFTVTTDSVHPILVNRASVHRLQQHPYLNYEQAEAIYTLRRRLFRLRSMHDLEQLDCLNSDDLLRLTPYLNFSD